MEAGRKIGNLEIDRRAMRYARDQQRHDRLWNELCRGMSAVDLRRFLQRISVAFDTIDGEKPRRTDRVPSDRRRQRRLRCPG